MAINITGFDVELFFAFNTAANVAIFSVFTLPSIIFGMLCIAGLISTKKIDWKLKVIIANVIAVDIVYSMGQILLYLGYPLRAYGGDENGYSCEIAASFLFGTLFTKPASFTLYTVVAYVFIKYGKDKIKWQYLVVFLIAIWLVNIGLFVANIVRDFTIVSNGFCVEQLTADSPLLDILTATIIVTASASCTGVTLVFSILTGCYVKTHTIQDDASLKKEMMKFLVFQWINVVVPAVAIICSGVVAGINIPSVILTLSLLYLVSVFYAASVLLTPLACFFILKPIRKSLKDMCQRCT